MSNIKIANLRGPAGSAGAQGVPGTVGPQGNPGQTAYSLTTAQVTIPAVGTTTTVALQSVSWANVGDYVSVQGAAGSGQSAVLQITAINTTNNILTLLNPVQGGGIPPASTSQPGLMNTLSGNTGDYVGGDNAGHNLITAVDPEIWSVRLRSFNAIGNPNFEVDQRLNGNVSVAGVFVCDRWNVAGPLATNCTTAKIGQGTPGISYVPGTNFRASLNCISVTLNTQKASLAATDSLYLQHVVEGVRFRELSTDVHSLTLAVQSTVAPLSFCVCLRDSTNAYTLTKICTVSTANVWTFITLPNLPIWTPSGTFWNSPGNVAYYLFVTLAAGTNQQGTPLDVWKASGAIGTATQDNFCAKPVNSVFYLGFVQHEPGPLCTTPIDCPFTQNLDDCLRYFQKTYNYATAPGTVTGNGMRSWVALSASTNAYGPISFVKGMAKTPTMTLYNHATGAANSVQDSGPVNHASAIVPTIGESGFYAINFATATTAALPVFGHYTADTGW